MANSFTVLNKLIVHLSFSKLGVYIEKNGYLDWHIFLCQSPQNFNPIYLKMLYKVILLTIIIINSLCQLRSDTILSNLHSKSIKGSF